MHIVLVVEDDALIRIGAVSIIEDAGMRALEASNADEAIRLLEAHPEVKAVFTDVDMPGSMDGLKLAHYIRNRWPPIKLIVASGKAIVKESELPPGSRFFPKPYRDHEIANTILQMVEGDSKLS